MSRHDIATQLCPNCGTPANVALNLTSDNAPRANAIVLCGVCGIFLRFDAELRFEVLPLAAIEALDRETLREMATIKLAWQRAIPSQVRALARAQGGRA